MTYSELCERQHEALKIAMEMLRKIDKEQQQDDREIKTDIRKTIMQIERALFNDDDLFKKDGDLL